MMTFWQISLKHMQFNSITNLPTFLFAHAYLKSATMLQIHKFFKHLALFDSILYHGCTARITFINANHPLITFLLFTKLIVHIYRLQTSDVCLFKRSLHILHIYDTETSVVRNKVKKA